MLGRDCIIMSKREAKALYRFIYTVHVARAPLRFYQGANHDVLAAWDALREAAHSEEEED